MSRVGLLATYFRAAFINDVKNRTDTIERKFGHINCATTAKTFCSVLGQKRGERNDIEPTEQRPSGEEVEMPQAAFSTFVFSASLQDRLSIGYPALGFTRFSRGRPGSRRLPSPHARRPAWSSESCKPGHKARGDKREKKLPPKFWFAVNLRSTRELIPEYFCLIGIRVYFVPIDCRWLIDGYFRSVRFKCRTKKYIYLLYQISPQRTNNIPCF